MNGVVCPHEAAVRAKLDRILGDEKGARVYSEIMKELALTAIASPDDVMRVAEVLEARGGMMALIGGSLMVHAHLHGAGSRR